jgi:hypothetical protein
MMRIKLQFSDAKPVREGAARLTEELRYRLFAEDKLAEFAAMGVSPEKASLLVNMQYRGREMSYAEAYPDAEEMLLCLEDGSEEIAAGLLLLALRGSLADCGYCPFGSIPWTGIRTQRIGAGARPVC